MDERELQEQPEEEPRQPEAELTGETQPASADSPREPSADLESPVEAAPIELPEQSSDAGSDQEAAPVEEMPEPLLPGPASSEPQEISAAEEEEAPVAESRPSRERRSGQSAQGELPPDASSEPAWYVIHCYSGYENKVRHNLEQRIETMGMKDKIFDVVIPTQEEIEVREGKRRTVERHIFPGYVLVNMSLSEESWYVVRNTPGVTGFVGMGNLPTALRPEEVSQIIKRMEAEAPLVKVSFKEGERVRIIDGPFNDFRGTVSEIDVERTKVRVMVSFFGRETPVELDFLQVEKA
jgi:transcription termination/antitermination protein NusG